MGWDMKADREAQYQDQGLCPTCQAAGTLWTHDGEIDCWRCGGSGEWVEAPAQPEPEIDLGPMPTREGMPGWRIYDAGGLVEEIASGEWRRQQMEIGWLTMVGDSPTAPKALFYRGRVNSIYGTPDSGKTFTTLICATQVMADGGHVMFIDFEDTPEAVYAKLIIDLGVSPEVVLHQFHYVVTESKMTPEDGQLLRGLLERNCCALVIVDSTGEGLAMDGKNQNADEDVANWMKAVPTMIANHPCHPAVVLIDHLPKGNEGKVVTMPIGSQRKQAVVRGASYHQEEVIPFSQRRSGYARLVCTKDKGGTYAHGQEVARLTVNVMQQPDAEGQGGMQVWDLLSVDTAKAAEENEALVRKTIIDVLLKFGADARTAIKGEVVDAVEEAIDVPRGLRVSDVLEKMVAEEVVASRECGKACADPVHNDGVTKKNANKTHYWLGEA